MRLGILGPMQVWDGAGWHTIGAPKWRALLAALLVRPGTGVSVQQLIDDVWGDDPPRGAVNQIHGYVGRVRRALGDSDGRLLVSRTPGYTLRLGDEDVDARHFEVLTAQGMAAQRQGDPGAASKLLTEALELWRGPALADVPPTLLVQVEAHRLDELRQSALESRVASDLELGHHADLVPELQAETAKHPLRERLWSHLMLALHRSGRQAEALDAYQRLHRHLGDAIGVEPDRRVQDLRQRILHGDAALELPAPKPATPSRTGPTPRQLPAAVRHFVGRQGPMDALDDLLARSCQATTTSIALVTGTAGVGKTSTVVQWAHRVADQFPDGQLYVNLRGFHPAGEPSDPGEAIRGFLGALDVAPNRVPATLDALVGLYRSVLAGRRMLVVLDNAHDVDQVRPLLPASAGCVVVVTSRNQLGGLVASEGAQPIGLDLLTDDEVRDLLDSLLGADRIGREPAAAYALVEHCARLPLAVSIAAARAAIDPGLSLADLAEQLSDTRGRLDQLDAGEYATNLRAVLSWSNRSLSPEARRLFRLLGLHPGPDITAASIASLAGYDEPTGRRLLRELTRAHLIAEHAPGRFTFHDLLRAYAAELAATCETDADRNAATRRVLDHYLHTAHRATMLLDPHRPPIPLDPPADGVRSERLDDDHQASDWFNTEHRVLLGVADLAAAGGFDAHTWQLAWVHGDYLDRRGHWQDWLRLGAAGVAGASRLGDATGLANAHRNLARAHARVGHFEAAHEHLHAALDLFDELNDDQGRADTHHSLVWLLEQQGQHAEALTHAEESLQIYRRRGNRSRQARALNTVAWNQVVLGQYDQAVSHCHEALALAQQLDDEAAQASVWDTIGVAHHHLGNAPDALACLEESLTSYRRQGDRLAEAEVLTHLAEAEQAHGDADAARGSWQQALVILEDLGHPDADEIRAKLDALPAP
jgi:DNA-binding SARP family transcriptional activator/tetratricopeptide (TPR) repeat protein